LKPVLAMIVVGLTPRHLGVHTPRLSAVARSGAMAPLETVTPAVTCSVQASFMTGLKPRDHGIVGNGRLFRDPTEVMFWRQSNRPIGGDKIWEIGKRRDPAFTCANMFWWRVYRLFYTSWNERHVPAWALGYDHPERIAPYDRLPSGQADCRPGHRPREARRARAVFRSRLA
jgi:predicted AlkP superfamily pyrophosphatase or phosphodiesterase